MKIIKLPEVMMATSLSRSTIYAFIQANKFPKQIFLGQRAVGWLENEINSWIKERSQLRGER